MDKGYQPAPFALVKIAHRRCNLESNRYLPPFRIIIQRHTSRPPMVSNILPYYRLATQFPQPRIMIRACGHQIRTICAEGTIPHPALMCRQRSLKRKCPRLSFGGQVLVALDVVRSRGINGPDSSVVVGRTSGEVADVGREEDAGYVGGMGLEGGYGD